MTRCTCPGLSPLPPDACRWCGSEPLKATCPGMSDGRVCTEHAQPCPECLRPCPEHSVTFCATCHKHEGECGYGSCQQAATHMLRFPGEARRFCEHHATAPAYGFARAGAAIEPAWLPDALNGRR